MRPRRGLRNRFDSGVHPDGQPRPISQQRDYYLATDATMRDRADARMAVLLETYDGERVGAWTRQQAAVDNNAAEFDALRWGVDLLEPRIPPGASLGVLLDHEGLAKGVAATVSGAGRTPPVGSIRARDWSGLRHSLATREDVQVVEIASEENPAHQLLAGPGPVERPDRCVIPSSTGRHRVEQT